jgi:hypothetical protein
MSGDPSLDWAPQFSHTHTIGRIYMITVRWEFVADGWDMEAAQRAVDRIQNRFQRALGNVRCPVHGAGPLLVVRGGSLEELAVDLETCCQSLVDETNARMQSGRQSGRAFGSRRRERRKNPRSGRPSGSQLGS